MLWFIILPAVVFGGAFVADLFDRFGDTPRVLAGYAGLLLTAIAVLGLLAATGGVILAALVSLARLISIREQR
ncbi:MAG: hypothetical protein R3325_14735 [Thermoanaerobaculia bacterium]|nr:hypothetical protein [Thermoanaerobaculia bacterium]